MQEKPRPLVTFREKVGTALGRFWAGRRVPERLRRLAEAIRRTARGGTKAP